MIALKIIETKSFMKKLFKSTAFDDFHVSSIDIATLTDFKISGTLNKAYFSSDELEIMGPRPLIFWHEIKDLIFHLIKGHKPPTQLKIIFSLPADRIQHFISTQGIKLTADQIGGLFINIKYDTTGLICTSGSSLKIFTHDKTLDRLWDSSVQQFLKKYGLLYENI